VEGECLRRCTATAVQKVTATKKTLVSKNAHKECTKNKNSIDSGDVKPVIGRNNRQ